MSSPEEKKLNDIIFRLKCSVQKPLNETVVSTKLKKALAKCIEDLESLRDS